MNKRRVGTQFEDEAVLFLEKNGYKIIDRNYRCIFGEIDIVADDNGKLVFIEVKYRANTKFGYPVMAVDIHKQHTIIKVALYYIKQKGISYKKQIRFDIVDILKDKTTLYVNAFEAF